MTVKCDAECCKKARVAFSWFFCIILSVIFVLFASFLPPGISEVRLPENPIGLDFGVPSVSAAMVLNPVKDGMSIDLELIYSGLIKNIVIWSVVILLLVGTAYLPIEKKFRNGMWPVTAIIFILTFISIFYLRFLREILYFIHGLLIQSDPDTARRYVVFSGLLSMACILFYGAYILFRISYLNFKLRCGLSFIIYLAVFLTCFHTMFSDEIRHAINGERGGRSFWKGTIFDIPVVSGKKGMVDESIDTR